MALITDLDDRTLVEQHHAGEEEAFRLIVLRHRRSLYANALRRLRDPAVAEDAVQECLLRAYLNLDRFDGDYHLDAWLHRILTNVCHDLGRRQGRDGRLFNRVSGEIELVAPAADDSLETLPKERLEEALADLPEAYREVLLLRFVDELSYPDVARTAGITEDNARARVSRGRSMLRRMLSGASAAVMWLIPPLRRNDLVGTQAEVANQVAGHATTLTNVSTLATTTGQAATATASAAPAIIQSTPVLTQATNLLTQAAPGLVQAAPVVSSSAPALGKAAVAVGIAASVAIPAGVAVEKRLTPAPAATAAPAPEAETVPAPDEPVDTVVPAPAPAPSSTVPPSFGVTVAPDTVGPLSGDGAIGADLGDDASSPAAGGSDASASPADGDGGSTPPAPAPTTSAPPTTQAPAPTTGGDAEPAPDEPAPAPAPRGRLESPVTVTEAGPRLELSGAFAVDVEGRRSSGELTGKLLVGDADPKDETAPRSVDGDLRLTLADGSTAELRVRGTVVVSGAPGAHSYAFAVTYRLTGADAMGLADRGDASGTLDRRGDSGSLGLDLPGATREDAEAS